MDDEFTLVDQVIARALLRKLPPKQRKALVLRFWHNYTLVEVAKSLRVSWGEADEIMKSALLALKDECMKQPRFSRALRNMPVLL